MKCISLWQPWAELLVLGAKKIETRSWPAPDWATGKTVAIHAAKRWKHEDQAFYLAYEEFAEALRGQELRFGAIIGIATLMGSDPTEAVRESLPYDELCFGNYDDGRYAWHFIKPRRFENAIPWTGAQGFFNVDDSVAAWETQAA